MRFIVIGPRTRIALALRACEFAFRAEVTRGRSESKLMKTPALAADDGKQVDAEKSHHFELDKEERRPMPCGPGNRMARKLQKCRWRRSGKCRIGPEQCGRGRGFISAAGDRPVVRDSRAYQLDERDGGPRQGPVLIVGHAQFAP